MLADRGFKMSDRCNLRSCYRLRAELEALPQCDKLELLFLLENVANMPDEVCQQYTLWMQADPVFSDSASCGWCQRRRLYWLASRRRELSPQCPPPSGWQWQQQDGAPWPELQYKGSRSHLRSLLCKGTSLSLTPRMWWLLVVFELCALLLGSFTTLQTEFPDRPHRPVAGSLLIIGALPLHLMRRDLCFGSRISGVSLSLMSGLRMMGLPVSCVAVKGDHAVRRAKQNSFIGNGFHIPTVMALLCMIPALLEAKLVAPPVDWAEAGLQARCQGTVWGA